jgi:choline dehydrogenase
VQADHVVVGAGSAGCTVAARLSGSGASVIVLEAGPSDWYAMIHIPAGMRSLLRSQIGSVTVLLNELAISASTAEA